MGLENDADLKRLREELQKERERVERLEKEVKEEVLKYILLENNRWRREWGKRHKAKGRGGKVGDLQGFMSNQDIQCWNQDQDLQG